MVEGDEVAPALPLAEPVLMDALGYCHSQRIPMSIPPHPIDGVANDSEGVVLCKCQRYWQEIFNLFTISHTHALAQGSKRGGQHQTGKRPHQDRHTTSCHPSALCHNIRRRWALRELLDTDATVRAWRCLVCACRFAREGAMGVP